MITLTGDNIQRLSLYIYNIILVDYAEQDLHQAWKAQTAIGPNNQNKCWKIDSGPQIKKYPLSLSVFNCFLAIQFQLKVLNILIMLSPKNCIFGRIVVIFCVNFKYFQIWKDNCGWQKTSNWAACGPRATSLTCLLYIDRQGEGNS